MQLYTCKTCNGMTEREGNYYVCKHCGNKWLIDADADVRAIDRANAWAALRDCDFEKSVELFENILLKDGKDYEAYWGCALASAGIIYVTDLNENKKVPTCNNITEESFINNKNVQKAMSLAPDALRKSYQSQAEQIDRIRLEWLEKASREPEYDVFICFKDSDREHGFERTQDSVDAQDLYNALVAEGYRVFFSRVSLRDKVSEQYEPYIYNAIKTAKVMIVFGEKAEYFSAVWVKNEWTRFRARIEKGEKHKNSLVTVYKNINPADLPVVLKSRQCLNASDMTFLSDLTRHIKRVIEESRKAAHLDRVEIKGGQIAKKATRIANESIQVREIGAGAAAETDISEKQQLDLAKTYMRARQWEDADKLVDDILFGNPTYADAILCHLMIKHQAEDLQSMAESITSFADDDYVLLEKTLNCSKKEDAASLLDLLYALDTKISEFAYKQVLERILPYNYEYRTERIREAFEHAIHMDHGEIFDLLLTTLASDEVDAYIQFNLKYALATKNAVRAETCLEAVLSVDAGNQNALEMLFDRQWETAEGATLIATLEEILKYSQSVDREILKVIERANQSLANVSQIELVKQALKYYSGKMEKLPLMPLFDRLIAQGFFEDAQFILNLVIAGSTNDPRVYWALCLVKTKSKSEKEIVRSAVLLKDLPEFTKYLTLVDEERRLACIKLANKQKIAAESRRKAKFRTKLLTALTASVCVVFIAVLILVNVVIPSIQLKKAQMLLGEKQYEEAYAILVELGDYKNAYEILQGNKRERVLGYVDQGEYDLAKNLWNSTEWQGQYSAEQTEIIYRITERELANGELETAYSSLKQIPDHEKYQKTMNAIHFAAKLRATELAGTGDYNGAYTLLYSVGITSSEYREMGFYQAKKDNDYKALVQTYGVCDLILPEGITSIADRMFAGCSNLKSIVIPDSVTSIGASAFEKCKGLTSIIIPDRVTSIGDNAFSGCTSLTSIIIPDKVTSIGDDTLSGCTSLTSATIGDGVTRIDRSVFYGCTGLTSITIPFVGETKDGTGNTNFGYIFGADSQSYIDYYIPKSLKTVVITGGSSVDSGAFRDCTGLKNVTIGDGVTSVGSSAFSGCTGLTSVMIGDGVTSIGDYAFLGCTSLSSVTIGDGVTSIGYAAFHNCMGLESITIPDSVTSILGSAFYGCSITTATIPTVAISYMPKNNLQTVVVTSGESIGDSAFENCTALKNVTILNSVTSIGNSAFSGCTSLTSVTIPDSVTSIGDRAFLGCDTLTSITIPDSVTSIGAVVFYGCEGLRSISIPDSVTSIGDSAFECCMSLASVTIPDSVTSIGENTFYGCTSLTSVTIPDSVTSIGNSAFSGCTSLTSVTIPDSVTSIGSSLFSGCTSLTSITIPDSVTRIGSYAFLGCTSLTSVYYMGSESDWSSISIGSSNSYLTNATRYYYSEAQTANGWRYVDGVPTPW